jgi:hypothetical protein
MRANYEGTKPMATEERWGVWITQDKPRKGQTEPDSYWWQGPDYKGDCILTKEQAEVTARSLQDECPPWRYEAKLYDVRVPRSDSFAPTCECGSRGTLHRVGCTSEDATRVR